MQALKYITITKSFEFSVKKITLLSIDEYKKYKHLIPLLMKCWWLRSPGRNENYAAIVNCGGDVGENGRFVYFDYYSVRPALKIQVSATESFTPGDKINIFGMDWTVLNVTENKLYILGDTNIGYHKFDEKNNVWENSELKQWLEAWILQKLLPLKKLV